MITSLWTGSDHRPLLLSLSFHAKKGRKKKRKRIDKRWKPDNHYIDKLTSLLAECRAESCSAQAKADKLQKALLQACEATAGVIDEPSVDFRLYDAQLRNLILMRRSIPSLGLSRHEANTRRISLCKQIQKVIRQKRSFEQDQKICAILKEFRDLKRLSSILGPSKSHGIVEIRDTWKLETRSRRDSRCFRVFLRRPLQIKRRCAWPYYLQAIWNTCDRPLHERGATRNYETNEGGEGSRCSGYLR